MASQIHVIPHFHWDREWYFTTEESKILLVNDMEEVLTMLEQNEDYRYFVLDGQTAILEDYLSVCPENKTRIEDLVRKNKLIIGPWYTQTDEMVVGGESIVRNLLYGMLDCKPFGKRMMIGYLPDSFGQSARLPQILNGFDINRCIFWRGTSERMGTDKTEFIWNGDDNSEVVVQLLPLGYAIGKYLPEDAEKLKERLDKYFPVLDKGATTDHILLPNGHDQMPIQKNIFDIMDKIEECYPGRQTKMSRYEEVFDIIEDNKENLAKISGEFLDGKYMRVHRSIYSTRADLKSANTRIENKITNILEPLASIAYSLGFSYHHGLVEAIWKELLKNHAHDSIGCCCSDKVHRAIADRFFLAEERADRLIDFYKRKIVDSMGMEFGLDKFTVFNTLPYERTDVITGSIVTRMKNFAVYNENGDEMPVEILSQKVVDAGLIDRQIVHYGNYNPFVQYDIAIYDTIPSMGYKTYFIRETDKALPVNEVSVEKDEHSLENEFYHIDISANGSLAITDKKTNITYKNVLLVEDSSDDGDEYDYSPLEKDFVVTSEHAQASIEITKQNLLSQAKIDFEMNIPRDLDSRKQQQCDSIMHCQFTITLKEDSPIIGLNLVVDNQSKDHRVRVLIPNQLGAQYSLSDNQFGTIIRPAQDSLVEKWQEEKWSERPDGIFPFLSYVTQDNNQGLAVITNSVREFELVGTNFNTIAITLFRSVGLLGKENLLRRPGRPSGIRMETPDSQMLGVQTFELALTTDKEHLSQRAKEYITPLVTYNKMPYNAMKLNPSKIQVPYSYSLVKINNPQITISAVKKEEQGKGILMRYYNATNTQQQMNITTLTDWKVDKEVALDESIKNDTKSIMDFQNNQIRTIRLLR
jgi:mannosylglycerate hydrolase